MDQRRREPRMKAAFPLEVESDDAVTIDMSNSGIAFESSRRYEIGEEITIRIVLGRRKIATPLSLSCVGHVVRCEPLDGGYRIAATVEWVDDDEPTFI